MAKIIDSRRLLAFSQSSLAKIVSSVFCVGFIAFLVLPAARPAVVAPSPQQVGVVAKTTVATPTTTTANPADLAMNDKIWANMNPQQQQAALADAMLHLASFAERINGKERRKWATHGPCETVLVGGKDGAHKLCNITMGGDRCNFISFGISTDYSFDVDLAEKWHCRGFAADPTIVHQSQFHPLVTFHNIAAKMLNPNEEAMSDGSSSNWWVTSMPALSKFLGIERVNILKLDCEGCEYSLARDILAEDPTFLHRVDQFSFEAHVSKQWLDSAEALYYYGMLLKLLDEAGLTLQASLVVSCFGLHEDRGCMDEVVKMGLPCGKEGDRKRGASCHDYLFARL